jgi:hypothetical protein
MARCRRGTPTYPNEIRDVIPITPVLAVSLVGVRDSENDPVQVNACTIKRSKMGAEILSEVAHFPGVGAGADANAAGALCPA